VLLVLLFTYSCEHGHPTGAVRALMITSGTVRLCGFVLAVVLNLATREDRRAAYTNALGTARVVQLQRAERFDVEDIPHDYGATGTYGEAEEPEGPGKETTFEERAARWRRHAARMRLPWEAGHGD